MSYKILTAAAAALLLAACGQSGDVSAPTIDVDNDAKALGIALSSIIVDTHIDVPYRLGKNPDDISQRTSSGDFDYPRAVSGGLNVAFMSIYTPAALEASGGSKQAADGLIDMVEGFVEQSPDKFALALSLTSVDNVGIGSDFVGVGDSLPVGLKDVATYPNLIKGLLERGYSEGEIRKILGENLLRVWQLVADYAATTSSKM